MSPTDGLGLQETGELSQVVDIDSASACDGLVHQEVLRDGCLADC
jgi:hypothetical protein